MTIYDQYRDDSWMKEFIQDEPEVPSVPASLSHFEFVRSINGHLFMVSYKEDGFVLVTNESGFQTHLSIANYLRLLTVVIK
jgi:hypothetical protein